MGQSHTHYDNLPVGEHSVLPVDGHIYTPKSLEYILLVTESSINTELLSTQRNNLQAVYPLVTKFYNDGYTLNQLKRIPCVKFDSKTLFQVILSRWVDFLGQSITERWYLHVKRSFVSTEHSNSTITTHVTELWKDIQEEASRGARLVSIEPTIPAAHHQVQEVDVFFDVPLHSNPSFFIYQAISVPVLWHRETHPSANALECDWFSHLITFLSEGWKLVEILFDSTVRHRVTVPSRTLTMNSVWVFEKRAEHKDNPSPRWEGVIVRYLHKSYTRFEDFRECYAKTSWNKVMHSMGKHGWELACIVTTPPSIQKGSLVTSINCKILLFFQRPFTGSKPHRRISSNTHGAMISPIRVDGTIYPEWSILGESHLEEGRPVILPPYSERGVDVGPLESTPDRSITQVPLPAEPPPTYAEAVAGDITVLFSTTVTDTSPTGNVGGPSSPVAAVSATVENAAPPVTLGTTSRTTNIQGMVTRNAQDVVPRNAQDVVPRNAQDVVPRNAQEMVPRNAQGMVPRNTQGIVPRNAQGMVPRNAHKGITTVNDKPVPNRGDSVTMAPPASYSIAPTSASTISTVPSSTINASVPSSTSSTSAPVSSTGGNSVPPQGTASSSAQWNGSWGHQQTSNNHLPDAAQSHEGSGSVTHPPAKPPRATSDSASKPTRPLPGTLPANSSHKGTDGRRPRLDLNQQKQGIHFRNGSATVGSSSPSTHKTPHHTTPSNRQPSTGLQAPPKSGNRQPDPRRERDRIKEVGSLSSSPRREKFSGQDNRRHVHPPRPTGQDAPGKYHAALRKPEDGREKSYENDGHGDRTSSTPNVTKYGNNRPPVRREFSTERSDHFSPRKRLGVTSEKRPVPKDSGDHWSYKPRWDVPRSASSVKGGPNDIAFNPTLVQKRRDRDYERVPGHSSENNGQKRSKDDINFSHHRRVKNEMDETVRAKFVEITNKRPGSGPSVGVKTLSKENGRVADQESHWGNNNHGASFQTRQAQDGLDSVRKESAVRQFKKTGPSESPKRQGKRLLPTYNQALMRRTRLHSDEETNTKSPPANLPDLIDDKRSGGESRRWVVKDRDDDVFFISSQVMPVSQHQRGVHRPQVRRHGSGRNSGRVERGVDKMVSQTSSSQQMLEASSGSPRFDRDMSDRRSLDSLQSFMEDQKRRPPEYETVLAKRVVKPKPLKQSHNTGPDLIEHTSRNDLPPQQTLPGQAGKSKAPLPSYQQVVYSRSGARPKLKSTQSDQRSSENIRRPEVQRYPKDEGQHSWDQKKVNEYDRLKDGQENVIQRKRRPDDSPKEAFPQKSSMAYPLEKGSRLSESPVGSAESFDLISQWSQDNVQPPPSTLNKGLPWRGIMGESTLEQSDGVRGNYTLFDEKQSYPGHSWSPEPSPGLDTARRSEDGAMDVKPSLWSADGQRNSALGTEYNKQALSSTTTNCSQENIFQSPSRTQRHVYVGKEIL